MDEHIEEQVESSGPQLETLSTNELKEFQKVNHQTISKLTADIELLKWKLKQFGPAAYQESDYNSLLRQEDPCIIVALNDKLQMEIEQCTNQLKETVALTGFTVDSFERQVAELDNDHCVKEFNMDGTVYNRRFRLSCTVDEKCSSEADCSVGGQITWFQIQFQEDIHKAIGQYVLKAAENIALHSAFSLLKTYLKWKKERDDIIVQLTNTYPDKISLFTSEDGLYSLKITSPKGDRPVFTVDWGRKTVENDSRIVPDIHLKVDAPEKWTAMDMKNTLGSAPDIFETMITALGVEKALKAFVELVVTDGGQSQNPLAGDHQQDAVS